MIARVRYNKIIITTLRSYINYEIKSILLLDILFKLVIEISSCFLIPFNRDILLIIYFTNLSETYFSIITNTTNFIF